MALTTRPIEGAADLQRMIALSCRYPAQHLRRTDLPYRLSSWALDELLNTRLWVDAQGEVLAWAVCQSPFWTIDSACDPAHEADLLPELLSWAEERVRALAGTAYARPCWFANVFSDHAGLRQALEAAGFADQGHVAEDAWSKVWMERPGELAVRNYRVPEGFTIRPLAGAAEAEAYVSLHQAVFESKNMTLPWRLRSLQQAEYEPELDLVVEAPDGSLAAFCIAWLNRRGAVLSGQIEPLGCAAAYRHLALGRLALAETLRRLQARGAQVVNVETDNYRDTAFRLYESLGFAVLRQVCVYRKDFE